MINIGILGSCVSRDSFNSKFNKDYSKFFNINLSAGRNSLISLMSKPIDFDETLIKIEPNTKENIFRQTVLRKDFDGSILRDLLKCDIEYLIIDNYFDVIFGILYLDDGSIITNNYWDLPDTEFFKNLNSYNVFQIFDNPKMYFDLWTKCCDKFFEFMGKYRPDIKIILNPVQLSYHAIRKDGSIDKNRYAKKADVLNFYLSKLDSYIINNFEVYLISPQREALADDSHLWGSAEVHFEKKFYHIFLENLKLIIIKDYYLNGKPNPFSAGEKISIKELMKRLDEVEKENFILDYAMQKNSLYSKSKINNIDSSKDGAKVVLENFIFSRPNNFIAPSLSQTTSIKLINVVDNMSLFISVYGRFGDYCEEDFKSLINIHKNDSSSNLVSVNQTEIHNIPIYNFIISNGDYFESIYLISKNNKTFRLTFKIDDSTVDTFKIVEEIYNSIEIN